MKKLLLFIASLTFVFTSTSATTSPPFGMGRRKSIKCDKDTREAIMNTINVSKDNEERIEDLEEKTDQLKNEITELRSLSLNFIHQFNEHVSSYAQNEYRRSSITPSPSEAPEETLKTHQKIEEPKEPPYNYEEKIDKLSKNMDETKNTLLKIQATSLIALIIYEIWRKKSWSSEDKDYLQEEIEEE
ncbi:MAG: hypothetical protein AAF335_02285 [Bacteroidota bacterium]